MTAKCVYFGMLEMRNISEHAQKPRVFDNCGGCSLQHIDYATQLENKKKMLANAVGFDNIAVFSGKEYGYRNRMDFIFHASGVGFRKKREWQRIIDIDKCEISDERINKILSEARSFFKNPDYFDLRKRAGTFRYIVIRTPQKDCSISFVLNSDSSRLADAIEKIKEFAKVTTADNVAVTYVPSNTDVSISNEFFAVKGKDMLKEEYLGKTFFYSVQGFFQNNSEMAGKMHSYCNDLLKKYKTKDATLLDLYSGVGTFGIISSDLFKEVIMLENDKNCVDAANLNIKENKCNNVKALLSDAQYLKKIDINSKLIVITDPPRSGMHPKTILRLKELKPEVIIYVSCNVQQLGKDISKFKNYSIKSSALFDFFPQTQHSESVVELVLKK